MPFDAFRTIYKHQERGCMPKQVERKLVEQRRLHETLQGKLTGPHMARQSLVRGFPWRDPSSNHTHKHILNRDLMPRSKSGIVSWLLGVLRLCIKRTFDGIV